MTGPRLPGEPAKGGRSPKPRPVKLPPLIQDISDEEADRICLIALSDLGATYSKAGTTIQEVARISTLWQSTARATLFRLMKAGKVRGEGEKFKRWSIRGTVD